MKMSLVSPLECCHVDTCLPDYWRGDSRAHLSIIAYPGMTLKEIKSALHSELNQGAIGGNDPRTWDDSGDVGDVWYKRAHAAINAIKPANKGQRRFFTDIEQQDEDADFSVYAYFVFVEKD